MTLVCRRLAGSAIRCCSWTPEPFSAERGRGRWWWWWQQHRAPLASLPGWRQRRAIKCKSQASRARNVANADLPQIPCSMLIPYAAESGAASPHPHTLTSENTALESEPNPTSFALQATKKYLSPRGGPHAVFLVRQTPRNIFRNPQNSRKYGLFGKYCPI